MPAGADAVSLLTTPMEAATARAEMILGAREEICTEYFIVGEDPFSLTGLALLRKAARRGVSVRLIIDAQWSKVPKAVLAHLLAEGVEVKVYHPFRLRKPEWLTRRLHDKLLVVDGREMLTGGRNIESPYFGLGRQLGRRNYIDCDIRIDGAVAAQSLKYFNALWNSREVRRSTAYRHTGGVEMAEALLDAYEDWLDERVAEVLDVGNPLGRLVTPDPVWVKGEAIRFLHDPVGRKGRDPGVGEALLELMDGAEESLLIESPYLVPSKALKKGLRRALDRGVRVRILTNSLAATDNIFPQAGYSWYKKPLVRMGVELWEHAGPDTCLHTKAAVIDDTRLVVGTYNLDPRSEHLNSEMAVVVDHPGLAAQMREMMERNLEGAMRIGADGRPEGYGERHPGSTFFQRFKLFLLKPVAPFIKKQL